MSKISCDICMDLIPLVQDGVASDASALAVKEHIALCPQCRALYDERPPMETNNSRINSKVKTKIRCFFAFLVLIGIFFGITLLVQEGIFYMALFLPFLGACSYVVFHWNALWKMPILLGVLLLIAHGISVIQGAEVNLLGITFWLIVNSLMTDIGTLIVGLLHFAFRKESLK